MAIVDMAYAQSGEPASSIEYNKVVDNVKDLDARTTENTSTGTNLSNRVAALEASTGVGYSVHMFHQVSEWSDGGSAVGQLIPDRSWTRVLFNSIDYSVPTEDITETTVGGGTAFQINKSGVWRVYFTGSMGATSNGGRFLFLFSKNTSDRRVYSEHVHTGNAAEPYSDSISGHILLEQGDTLACWIWHDVTGGLRTWPNNGRVACSLEWVAPLSQIASDAIETM